MARVLRRVIVSTMDDDRLREWLRGAKLRGLDGLLRTSLDVGGLWGPLAAQMLYVGEPMLRHVLRGAPLNDLAESLETPEGVARLRQWLDQD